MLVGGPLLARPPVLALPGLSRSARRRSPVGWCTLPGGACPRFPTKFTCAPTRWRGASCFVACAGAETRLVSEMVGGCGDPWLFCCAHVVCHAKIWSGGRVGRRAGEIPFPDRLGTRRIGLPCPALDTKSKRCSGLCTRRRALSRALGTLFRALSKSIRFGAILPARCSFVETAGATSRHLISLASWVHHPYIFTSSSRVLELHRRPSLPLSRPA